MIILEITIPPLFISQIIAIIIIILFNPLKDMYYEQLKEESGVNWAKECRVDQEERAELSKLCKPIQFSTPWTLFLVSYNFLKTKYRNSNEASILFQKPTKKIHIHIKFHSLRNNYHIRYSIPVDKMHHKSTGKNKKKRETATRMFLSQVTEDN